MIYAIKHRFVRIYQSYFPEPLSEKEYLTIRENLEEPLRSLFFAQPLCDQRHGLLVYEKCKKVFENVENAPSDEELFLAGCFHDVAKKDCKFSVSQRVVFATILLFIPENEHRKLRHSKSKMLRRIGIYIDHAHLSWELISPHVNSKFVYMATSFHHGYDKTTDLTDQDKRNIALFIQADTL